ncbi:MAG TPA: cytochrome c [Terriglobia bacterium]|nr:cytochrome c [Terriglobia bacterium]
MLASHAKLRSGVLVNALILLGSAQFLFRPLHKVSAAQTSESVAEGRRLWIRNGCDRCHAILGTGGHSAPDVTRTYAVRGEAWLRAYLADPARHENGRRMPNLRLSPNGIRAVIAYLAWASALESNTWPPGASAEAAQAPQGYQLFLDQHCDACHTIQGRGGSVGPDLSREGARHTRPWVLDQINNPRNHRPDSIMFSFAQLPEADKNSLAEYLASLK